MNITKEFVRQMGNIMGKKNMDLNDNMSIHKIDLEENCEKIQNKIIHNMCVDISKGYEPCHLCCSNRNKKAEMVWIGLNPGKRLKKYLKLPWESAKWQDIADYCMPENLLDNKKNVYDDLLNGKELTNSYYIFLLRLYLAILDVKKYNVKSWDELKTVCQKNSITTGDLFKEIMYNHPVINAELVPYKSNGISFSSEKLIEDEQYGNYFNGILKIIEEYSNDDAYVIFYGVRDEVIKLMKKFALEWVPNKEEINDFTLSDRKFKMYVYKRGNRKIILLPFFRINGFDVRELVDKINAKFENI